MKICRRSEVFIASSVVGLGAILQAEEAQNPVRTALSSTTLSGYVDTSAIWKFGTGNQLVGRSYDGTAKQDGFKLGAEGIKPAGGERFFAETFTIDYQLFANVISRVEFRWDHDLTARGGSPAPFGNDDKDAASLAFNLIYRF